VSDERDLVAEARRAIGELAERLLRPVDLRAVLATEAAADVCAALQRQLDVVETSKWRCIGPHRQQQNAANLAQGVQAARLLLALADVEALDAGALRALWARRALDAGALCAWVAALASTCAGGLLCGTCPSCGAAATFTAIGEQEDGNGGSFPLVNCSACGSTVAAVEVLAVREA